MRTVAGSTHHLEGEGAQIARTIRNRTPSRARLARLVRRIRQKADASARPLLPPVQSVATSERDALALLDAVDDAVFVIEGSAQRITYANAAAARLSGYTRDDLLGREALELSYQVDPVNARRRIEQSLERSHSPVSYGSYLRRRDGSLVRVDIQLTHSPLPGISERFVAIVRDARERHAVEGALLASEARMRHLMAVAPVLLFAARKREDRWVLVWGAPGTTRFGIDADHRMDFDALLERVHPDDRALASSSFDVALGTGASSADYRLVFDGRERWVHGRLVRMSAPADDGEIIGSWCEFADSHPAEDVARTIVQTIVDCIVTIDASGRIRSVNAAVMATFGYSEAELVGQNITMLMGGLERLEHDGYLARYLAGGTPRIIGIGREVKAYTRDGSELTVELSVTEFTVMGERFFTGILRDVTARRRAESALRASEQRWRFALEGTGDGIWTWEIGADRYEVTSAWRAMLGYDDALRVERPEDWESLIHPEDLEGVMTARRRHLDAQDSAYRMEYRLRAADAQYRWILDRGMVVDRSPDGVPLRMIGTQTDVTERHRVLDELERAKTDAEKANRAKSAFLASMSHEIRTPMNGVLGMLDVLARYGLTAELGEIVATARQSASALLRVIDDVLDFSKIEADRLTICREPTPIADVVYAVAETIHPHALSQNVVVRAFCDPRLPPTLDTDVVRIRQVLYNLVGNGVKFSSGPQHQGGEVVVRADAVFDDLGRVTEFCFQVHDNGIGIPPETLPRLFKPFEQGEATTTRRFGGTGLGLSITKRLVELLGGTIDVASQPGLGTTFRVCFPSSVAQPTPGSGALQGFVCLLDVDDERIRTDIASVLAHAGVERFFAASHPMRQRVLHGDGRVPVIRLCTDIGELEQARSRPRCPTIVLTQGTKRRPRRVRPGVTSVDCCLLRPEALVDAVLMALEWSDATPEVSSSEFAAPIVTLPPEHEPVVPESWGPVLVAEDNPINQKVILRQLAMLGIEAEIASDGREALNRWRTFHHRLVFTDIHMPAMDGYELARSIRREEPSPGRTCIIAISANVIDEKDAYDVDADFDLRVSKPVQLGALEAALRHIVSDSVREPEVAQVDEFPLDLLRDMVGADDGLVAELLADFVHDTCATLAEMEQAASAIDLPAVRKLAHRLKSSALTVGAREIGEACAVLEAHAGAADPRSVDSHVRRLSRMWDSAHRSMRQTLRSLERDYE